MPYVPWRHEAHFLKVNSDKVLFLVFFIALWEKLP